MVKTDRCDHAGNRIFYCCCCIQSAAKPCLKHYIIHPGICKDHHSHQEQKFKICRMIISFFYQFICQRFDLAECMQKRLIIDIFLIDLKTLVDHDQMRRSKESAGISCLSQNRRQECTGTSLAVCTCHMDHAEFILRITKTFQTFLRMLHLVLGRKFRDFFNISNCLFVIHKKIHHFIL